MYKYLLLTLFSIISVHGLHSQDDDSLSAKVMTVHNDKIRFLENQQLDSLAAMLHQDLLYIHSNGWQESKDEVIANQVSGKLRYNTIDIKKSKVRVIDHTAVVTAQGTFNVTMSEKPLEINLFYTEVYVIIDEKILLLSRHACKIVDFD